MKTLNVTVNCIGVYNSSIHVPDGMTIDEAIKYASELLDSIPLTHVEWAGDVCLDEENCDFDEND
jgi:hypothetical protein